MNILLVEDDHDSRILIGKFLRELGHQVVECNNGCDALETFKAGEFHMVLSDIKLPKMSGLELLRAISSLPTRQDVDIVLFTGYGNMESAIEALRAGAYDYLLKPINFEEMTAITERIAEHLALRRENKVLTEKFEEEVKAATAETEFELSQLRKAYAQVVGIGEIGIFSKKMGDIFQQARKFHTDRSIPVSIQGETGTGKEIIARYIHYGDSGATTPFIDINCAALTPSVFESELFGYEAGSFTGGLPKGQKGKLDIAMGGTIFLDEITEMPVDLQTKLLRVIQEKEFYRVGGLKKIKADVRIMCATNADIEEMVKQGSFRQDLYYRLSVGRILLPPLRERTEEILPLAIMFLNKFAKEKGKRFCRINDAAAKMLLSHRWPGNVRELKNTMEWAVFMHDDIELKPSHLGILTEYQKEKSLPAGDLHQVVDLLNFILTDNDFDLETFINEIVRRALEKHKGNKTETARYLGISRSSLYCRLERLRN